MNSPDRSSHSSCERVWLRYTKPVGISWENKLRLITDQAHIPSWAVLRDKAAHQFSHMVIVVSVRVRVRPTEAHGWRRFTELLML